MKGGNPMGEYAKYPRMTCYITKNTKPERGVFVEGPYNEDFLFTLKLHVPDTDRYWDPDARRWWVSDKYASQVKRDADSHYDKVIEC